MGEICELLKYEGDNSTFVWKHPSEDFNTLTQLVVHESQEALFFMNGAALDLFGPGRYTLETQNIPKIGKFLNRATDDQTPFHCEVYFANKTEQMSIKWGTDSKVQYLDPQYGFPLSIGLSGEMALKISDTRKLLIKLVGTESVLTQSTLTDYFRAFLMTRIKTYVAQVIMANSINIFEIDENLTLFSDSIHKLLTPDFADYGLELTRFLVTNVVKPDGERQYERYKAIHYDQVLAIKEAELRQKTEIINAQTDAQKVIIDSQAQATKRMQEGYTYQQERGFDVAEDLARNESSGSELRNDMMGLGMGVRLGGTMGTLMGGIVDSTFGSSGLMQPVNNQGGFNANAQNNMAASGVPGMINLKEEPAPTAPEEPASPSDDLVAFKMKVDKLTMMRDAGILSEEEFNAQKNELLKML